MLQEVGRVRGPGVREVWLELHRQVDHLHHHATSSPQHMGDRLYDHPDVGNRNARSREHPSLGAEVVLHVHDNHGRRARVDRKRLRPRVDDDAVSFIGQTKQSIPEGASRSKPAQPASRTSQARSVAVGAPGQ